MIHLSDAELITLLADTENIAAERKSAGDVGDVLPTAVAFANSQPLGVPGVIFLPVRNDGTVETTNLDSLQQKATRYLNRAYPPLPHATRLVRIDGRELLAILVWGSDQRPHFSGPAFVRQGSETRNASESLFQRLVAQRSAVGYKLAEYLGKTVQVRYLRPSTTAVALGRVLNHADVTLEAVTPFWVNVRFSNGDVHSLPLPRVQLAFEPTADLLVLEVLP